MSTYLLPDIDTSVLNPTRYSEPSVITGRYQDVTQRDLVYLEIQLMTIILPIRFSHRDAYVRILDKDEFISVPIGFISLYPLACENLNLGGTYIYTDKHYKCCRVKRLDIGMFFSTVASVFDNSSTPINVGNDSLTFIPFVRQETY